MIDSESQRELRREIAARMHTDRVLLDTLRQEIRPLIGGVKRIQPRATTSISLAGTDGGNNRLQFDPFLVQLIRVVDSANNEYSLEAVTPTMSVAALSARQFDRDGRSTSLGTLMRYLRIRDLSEISPMIPRDGRSRPPSPSWVHVYRELLEWAALFTLVREKDFGADTLIVFDGLLRNKVFAGDLFKRYLQGIQEGIEAQLRRHRRQVYLVGMAKSSRVLERYRLAMTLEGILTTAFPAYVEIPRVIEEKAHIWADYACGEDPRLETAEVHTFVGAKMFFVKFGSGQHDPVWPIDLCLPQVPHAQAIMDYLLSDALEGFPVPFYPRCLQRAQENAALVAFDLDILQDEIFEGIRLILGEEASALDAFRLQEAEPANARSS